MEEKRKILPLAWLLLAMLAQMFLHGWLPLARMLEFPWTLAGLGPGFFGLWMAVVSAGAFRRADTGLVPFDEATSLVTEGFFRHTRNPMYLGMVSLLAGLAMLYGTAGTLLPIPLFAWIIHRNFILGEERFMEAAFGDEYLAYKSQVRRWL